MIDARVDVVTVHRPRRIADEIAARIEAGKIGLRPQFQELDGGGIETPLGDGGVDWTELMPTLVDAEYSGWVCIERTGGDQRDEDVRTAVASLRTLLPVPG